MTSTTSSHPAATPAGPGVTQGPITKFAHVATGMSTPFSIPFCAGAAALLVTVPKVLFGEFPHVPYLTTKGSILNQYFAKWAWLWTSIVFVYSLKRMRHWTQERKLWAIVRFSMATGFWLALTQWFFGPSLLDRFNRQTGGSCTPSSALLHSLDPALRDHFSTNAVQAETLRDCRAYNGVWTHGHDVSGHCLLLIHSILFLNLEFLTHGNGAAAHTRPNATEQPQDERKARRPYRQAAKLIHGLTALWTLVLVITMMYYHNLSELVNGIVAGTLFCAIAYSPVHMGTGNGGSA